MSVTTQQQSLTTRSGSREARIGRTHGAPGRVGHTRRTRPGSGGVPSVMGPANRAPGVPIMGTPSAMYAGVMGGADAGARLALMGGPDAGPRLDLMGESDLRFVDALFTPRAPM